MGHRSHALCKSETLPFPDVFRWRLIKGVQFEACSGAANLKFILSFLAPGASIVSSTSTVFEKGVN